jgi:uncharacterized membrane protein
MMGKTRLEAFSDGVIAIIITIMVLEMKVLSPWISIALHVAVALMWLVPDRRIERALAQKQR